MRPPAPPPKWPFAGPSGRVTRSAFVEPSAQDALGRWAAIVAAVLPGHGVEFVIRRPSAGAAFGTVAAGAHAAADVARELDAALGPRVLDGLAREHAAGSIASAERTLERLARDGWTALTGAASERGGRGRLGGDAVVPAADRWDPVDRALG